MQLVENALRTDLKPVEQARAYRRLMDAKGYSTRDLAAELHIAQTSVVRAVAILDLPADVQVRVEGGELAATVAAELSRIADPTVQAEVAEAIVAEGLTRSEVTELVQAVKARRPAPGRRPRAGDDRPGRLLHHDPLEEGFRDHGIAGAPQGRQAGPGARATRASGLNRGGSQWYAQFIEEIIEPMAERNRSESKVVGSPGSIDAA